MKKFLLAFLAACAFTVSAKAEGTGTKYNAGAYNVYKSSNAISNQTGQALLTGPAILHKVIISSPAYSASISSAAATLFEVHDAFASGSNLKFKFDVSTYSITGATEYTFDVAMSSGIYTDFSGIGTTAGVNLIYSRVRPGSADKYKVWTSSAMPADTAVHRIAAGPVLLHKIIVLAKGTGTAVLTAYDSYVTASPSATRRMAAIDLTDSAREYTYDVLLSSGITIQSSGAGTVSPYYIVIYKRNPSQDYEVWKSTFTTGTATTSGVVAGTDYILGGVINGDSVSGSSLTLYDSYGTANSLISTVDGTNSFDRRMYDVNISSGLTYSSSGNGLYTILYKRRAQ